jgi:hypothetical protein
VGSPNTNVWAAAWRVSLSIGRTVLSNRIPGLANGGDLSLLSDDEKVALVALLNFI